MSESGGSKMKSRDWRFGLVASVAMAMPMSAVGGCGPAGHRGTGGGGDDDLARATGDMTASFSDVDLATGPPPPPPCNDGLKCQQVDCGENVPPTALIGKVFAPNGTLPIYNALVYIPNADLDPFQSGVICDVCSAHASGKPIVTALTDATGTFRLDNVPVGDNIPMVIQMGRWRRKVIIPHIDACQDNVLSAKTQVDLQRLPRRKGEGDIPRIAIATGVYDPVECLLHKLGIDDKEVTNGTGAGRIHLYNQGGTDSNPPADKATALYDDINVMKRYDMIVLPCATGSPTPMEQANLAAYADAGGRVFATDLKMDWLKQAPWMGPINWMTPNISPPYNTTVEQSFPKGKAFAKWLQVVGASQMAGALVLTQAYGRLEGTMKPVQRWLYGKDLNNNEVDYHFTFNTPIHPPPVDGGVGPQCGRVLYSSFHVSAGALNNGAPRVIPGACADADLTPQEKALAFMIFDLTACVQMDDEMPTPPPP
jgi:hypothetical protein